MTIGRAVRLSLVAHTNVGKTTLARTLLGRDVGEVRDAPHVTEFAEMHVLLTSDAGDTLELWDTPGFGDSVRLVRRLRRSASPIGWFLSAVWDRWRDRAFWSSQQALRHVRDTSDIVLYLVNASEAPAAAAYVGPEMDLLGWVGKPVLVLLNQLGAPGDDAADLARWRAQLQPWPQVREVLALDAFARCWVQEGVLLRAIEQALSGDAGMARLRAAWARQRLATFDGAVDELAASLARIAATRVPVADAGWLPLPGRSDGARAAQQALADALDTEVRASTTRLVALHGLQGRGGRVEREILDRVAHAFDLRQRIGEGRAAWLGGVVSGALAGLKADIASGGLTLGGGMLAGGLLGALGAAGIARGINVARGVEHSEAGWSAAALTPLLRAALLRYLAVAHFGRGRGDWVQGEAPAHWAGVVDAALAPRLAAVGVAWQGDVATGLQPLIGAVLRDVLTALYPGCWPGAPGTDGGRPDVVSARP